MKAPKLSIVIPALNEENYLPRLLKSINHQNYPCEVIVADSQSDDATKMIAKAFGCKVISARRGRPAYARNAGALASSGDLLLFLDADVILPRNFLRKNISQFMRKRLDVAGGYLLSTKNKLFDLLIWDIIANGWLWIFQFFYPEAFGGCILTKKTLFKKLNGFDETITFAEDVDYIKRANKLGARFRMLKKNAYVSARRFDREGRFKLTAKYLMWTAIRFFKVIRKDINYSFGNY